MKPKLKPLSDRIKDLDEQIQKQKKPGKPSGDLERLNTALQEIADEDIRDDDSLRLAEQKIKGLQDIAREYLDEAVANVFITSAGQTLQKLKQEKGTNKRRDFMRTLESSNAVFALTGLAVRGIGKAMGKKTWERQEKDRAQGIESRKHSENVTADIGKNDTESPATEPKLKGGSESTNPMLSSEMLKLLTEINVWSELTAEKVESIDRKTAGPVSPSGTAPSAIPQISEEQALESADAEKDAQSLQGTRHIEITSRLDSLIKLNEKLIEISEEIAQNGDSGGGMLSSIAQAVGAAKLATKAASAVSKAASVAKTAVSKTASTATKAASAVNSAPKASSLAKGLGVAGAALDVGMGVADLAGGQRQTSMPSGWDMISPMRWGMYAGEKINQGISAVSGGQSLGSMLHSAVNGGSSSPVKGGSASDPGAYKPSADDAKNFTSPEKLNGMAPELVEDMRSASSEAGVKVELTSGFRDSNSQAQLFSQAVQKYGSEEAARKWAAPPGKSPHESGFAVDINSKGISPKLVKALESRGMHRPLSNEPWHWESKRSRGVARGEVSKTLLAARASMGGGASGAGSAAAGKKEEETKAGDGAPQEGVASKPQPIAGASQATAVAASKPAAPASTPQPTSKAPAGGSPSASPTPAIASTPAPAPAPAGPALQPSSSAGQGATVAKAGEAASKTATTAAANPPAPVVVAAGGGGGGGQSQPVPAAPHRDSVPDPKMKNDTIQRAFDRDFTMAV